MVSSASVAPLFLPHYCGGASARAFAFPEHLNHLAFPAAGIHPAPGDAWLDD
jgi:hypothetical protein